MSPALALWLGGAMAAFLTASAALKSYALEPRLWTLLAALVLYTAGNLMMVRLMRANGMAVAISISAILQLVLANAVAVLVFGERPGAVQMLGIALGIVAITLILFPGERAG